MPVNSKKTPVHQSNKNGDFTFMNSNSYRLERFQFQCSNKTLGFTVLVILWPSACLLSPIAMIPHGLFVCVLISSLLKDYNASVVKFILNSEIEKPQKSDLNQSDLHK